MSKNITVLKLPFAKKDIKNYGLEDRDVQSGSVTFEVLKLNVLLKLEKLTETAEILKLIKPNIKKVVVNDISETDLLEVRSDVLELVIDLITGNKKK